MCFVYIRFFWVWWCDRNGQMKLRWMVRMCMWCVSLLLVIRTVTRRSFFLIPFSTHSTISKTDKDNIFLFSLLRLLFTWDWLQPKRKLRVKQHFFVMYIQERILYDCTDYAHRLDSVRFRMFSFAFSGFFPVSFYICSHFNLFKVWEKRIPILATATGTN